MGWNSRLKNSDNRQALESTTPLNTKTTSWLKDPGLRPLNFGLFFLLFGDVAHGFDGSLINNLQQINQWQDGKRSDFDHPRASLLGAMSASYWIGNILGVILIPLVADRLGRRIAIATGSGLCIVGAAICAATVSHGAFIAGRILLGMGGVMCSSVSTVLMTELAYPSHRATATALSSTTYSVGAILAAWVAFGSFRISDSWAWRTPTLIQAFPSAMVLCGLFFLPESPRWLCSKGKEQTALDILTKYHGAGDADDAVVQHEYAEIKETIEAEITQNKNPFHLKALFATPGNRWRSFIIIWCGICKQWSGNGLVSYYLGSMLKSAGITKQIETTLITATSQMFSFACSFAFAFLPARVGRRPLMLTSMAGMWVVFAVITATSGAYVETGNRHASYTTVAFIYLYSGVHNLGWTGAQMLYIVEILPYTIRAKGMAMFSLVAGICGAFNTYVNPLGIAAMSWKFYFFYVGWIIVQFIVVYLFFPETKGPSLEQIALLFDGRDAQMGRVNVVAEEMLDEKGGVEFQTKQQQ
ncbi:sugar transporter [Colletotrichum abscissum]|uniref:Sugar transporter n=1 Tax=Colletotrichum abscissum TaxID=1671311 RepID=A0A9P9XM47_9PEZI|nr:sugar transporter [Colletotrichum abscissum]KAI3556672.1 sugar transporter [Colletotrichum abscissum]KAK1505452.1 sugar transporter [Colletotrichum abscissum]